MYIKGRKVQRVESRRTRNGTELRFYCSGGRGTMYIAGSVSSESLGNAELMATAAKTLLDAPVPAKS